MQRLLHLSQSINHAKQSLKPSKKVPTPRSFANAGRDSLEQNEKDFSVASHRCCWGAAKNIRSKCYNRRRPKRITVKTKASCYVVLVPSFAIYTGSGTIQVEIIIVSFIDI